LAPGRAVEGATQQATWSAIASTPTKNSSASSSAAINSKRRWKTIHKAMRDRHKG